MCGVFARGVAPRHLGTVGRLADRDDIGARQDLGASLARSAVERPGNRAHAAGRDLPVARAVTDHVVEEAAVLLQRGVVRAREGADQAVGQDHAAQEVVID